MVITGGQSVCSHSSGRTGSGCSYLCGSPATESFGRGELQSSPPPAVTLQKNRRSSPQGRCSPRARDASSQRGGRRRSSPQGRGSPRARDAAFQRGGLGQSSPQGRGFSVARDATSQRDGRRRSSPQCRGPPGPPAATSTAAALSATGDDSSSSHVRVFAMKYHNLQKECKSRNLKATGTAEQLKNRLMGKVGKFILLYQT